MSEPSSSAQQAKSAASLSAKHAPEPPTSVLLVPYPKIVFLYPTFVASILAAIIMAVFQSPESPVAGTVSIIFLGLFAVNLVILAFDFPRTTSLTLFFFAIAVVMGVVLLFKFKPEIFPILAQWLAKFHPVANATFYWAFAAILGAMFIAVFILVRFDYWEVRPNEMLHHHGFLSNLERLSAPNLRMEKEINDVFEYLLLQSGRLIIQTNDDRRAIVLDNVPMIKKKEQAITRMLGALQVQVRPDNAAE